MDMKRVVIFGVFDGLHEGHKALFREAKKYGDELVVVLTPDIVVQKLKKHAPKLTFEERKTHLRREDDIAKVIEGDAELSSWAVIGRVSPDVIVLGYDQVELRKDLEQFMGQTGLSIPLIIAPAFKPEEMHSSILNRSNRE